MTGRTGFTLATYAPWRRTVEIGGWVAFYLLNAAINSVVVILDVERMALDFAPWKPVVWEFSSNLVLLALVPAVAAFYARYPLHWDTWRANLPRHAVASVVYSAVHVVAMVALRQLAYATQGERYDFGDWPSEFAYEYLKDVRGYAAVLFAIWAYRLLLLRLQGEARLLDAPDEGLSTEPVERPERFLVRKLGREFLVAAREIERIQAAGNYVNLHVRGRDYPLRSTIAAIESRLDPARFVRVHRSWIVNMDEIAEIEPLDTGDARIRLRDGTVVPCSRRYRAALRAPAESGEPRAVGGR